MKHLRIALALALLCSHAQAASTLTVYKTPTEAFNCGANFAQVASADGISLVSITATDLLTGSNVTSTLIAASPAPVVATVVTINGVVTTGQYVIFRVQGGANNQRVLVDVVVTDNVTGETRDGQLTLVISSGTGH